MARTEDQARWERKAREQGRQRVAVWLSQEAVEHLDAFVAAGGHRGRGEALERLLCVSEGRPAESPAAVESPTPVYRLKKGQTPGGYAAWSILVDGGLAGYAWRDGREWVAASSRGLVPHWYRQRTRARAIEMMLRCELPDGTWSGSTSWLR